MNRPLRLLNLIRTLDPEAGGPVEGLRQSVAATRALGHIEEVLTLDDASQPWVRNFAAPTHALGPARGNYGYTPRLLPWLRRHAGSYDALVVHGLWQYHGLLTRRALLGSAVPYFVYPHGMLDPWFKQAYPGKHAKKWFYWMAAERCVLRDAAAVLFTTQEESRLAPQTFPLLQARHEVLGYGLALDEAAMRAQASDFLQRFESLKGSRLLLFLGRLHPKKGCELLIEAFAAVAPQDRRLHLVMAGPAPADLLAALQSQVQRLGLVERVTFTGMLQGAEKWGALRAAEAFVLPSHQENFGVAVAEALALGVPALLSTQVNIWREVLGGGAGLAEADTLAGTQRLLSRWLALSPEAQALMRAAAAPCFERHFQADAWAQRMLALVRSTRDGGAASRLSSPAIRHSAHSQPCHTRRPD